MISEISAKHLTSAGWYEGRKINITENVRYLEELGYSVFDSAKKFMEEYGELDITDKYIGHNEKIFSEHHTTCLKDLFYNNKKFDLDVLVGEMTIPVLLECDEVYIYISESGKFYRDAGLLYENSDELWDSLYTENGVFILKWNKIIAGEKRVKRKRHVKKYVIGEK